ncbi:hypothetical protein [Nonomuraea sp. LPB2021202275-12-8]|uniref:hypothetical protein n=1 Tax=Nonomuraea sp. LPB2021202275-12-8 TaxID=3120159 RepID=UPI00300C8386
MTHVKEIARLLLGEDPSDIGRIYDRLLWAGASVGRSGVATQAIASVDTALWDVRARRAGLPLAKLLGAYRDSVRTYNTSGGYLQAPIDEVKEKAWRSLQDGIGGIKIKVGQPDLKEDLRRLAAVREHLGDDVPPASSSPTCPAWAASRPISRSRRWPTTRTCRWRRTS